ncbi:MULTISPECIES: hypothetical protein [unclassified Arsukibacterium]|uniref:hypothetical protein n=1 Tax=unclassified Arsukibacterium TaxID=2635278 RepID=UPI0025BACC60|nr:MULTISPECIES: hypothetical protein [unclassified Arsukibacterium]
MLAVVSIPTVEEVKARPLITAELGGGGSSVEEPPPPQPNRNIDTNKIESNLQQKCIRAMTTPHI